MVDNDIKRLMVALLEEIENSQSKIAEKIAVIHEFMTALECKIPSMNPEIGTGPDPEVIQHTKLAVQCARNDKKYAIWELKKTRDDTHVTFGRVATFLQSLDTVPLVKLSFQLVPTSEIEEEKLDLVSR